MRYNLRLSAGVVFLGCLLVAGCSNQGSGTTLSGAVTYKGQPVTGGELKLYYPDKHVVPIAIKADGTFATTGAPAGNVKVTIDTSMFRGSTGTPHAGHGGKGVPKNDMPKVNMTNVPKYVAIPRQYADPNKTPLSWDIKGSSEQMDVTLTN